MVIGKRKRIDNMRMIWPREPDFSDWLTSEDGVAMIAEDIGIQIEDAVRESRPGDFPCDIVGHEAGNDDHVVVIENQFGRTNHDHLGKLLTYASMHAAMTAIWIAEYISDDHRKVVDWLNENTPPTISFFLAQIRAYQIGDSPAAPQLDVVCRPNLTAKAERVESSGDAARHAWRRQFWTEILGYIEEQHPPFRVQSPNDDAWSTISIGRSNFVIALTLTPKRRCIGCELAITVPWKNEALEALSQDKDKIEREIGHQLDWQPMLGKKMCRIMLEAQIDPKDDANRDAVKRWMHETSVSFFKAFSSRAKQLSQPVGVTGGNGDDE